MVGVREIFLERFSFPGARPLPQIDEKKKKTIFETEKLGGKN